jgi:hypothetical protein
MIIVIYSLVSAVIQGVFRDSDTPNGKEKLPLIKEL